MSFVRRWIACCLTFILLSSVAVAAEGNRPSPVETSGWAHAEVSKAIALGLPFSQVYDTREPITRGDFALNAASLVAIEFGSNLKSYLLITRYRGQAEREAYFPVYPLAVTERLGILQGRGDGTLDSYACIPRQEAAVMLARTYRTYRDMVPDALAPTAFSDQDQIADWALDDVRLMNHLGIMTGVGDGRFDPQGNYTIEQCLVSLLRLHEKAPYDGAQLANPFPIPAREVGFSRSWSEPYDIAFAVETEDYYICALDYSANYIKPGASNFEISVVDRNLSLRSYPTPILTRSTAFGGAEHTRPEHPAVSEDGTRLFYTATLEEDAYHFPDDTTPDKTLIFQKGVYTVTMDLATGAQTWVRTDLT